MQVEREGPGEGRGPTCLTGRRIQPPVSSSCRPTKSCDFVGRSVVNIHIFRCFFRMSEV